MTEIRKIILIVPIAAALVAAGTQVVGTAAAQTQNSSAVQEAKEKDAKEKEKKLAVGEVEARQMLLLMDRDQSGKVSKAEFMSFMESEFQRLDVNKDGELDVKELTRSRLVPTGGRHR